jgi:hypothetical protein
MLLPIALLSSPAFAGPGLETLPVDVHLTLCAPTTQTLRKFDLNESDAKSREVWFFDTKNLDLFEQGLNIRARQKEDADKAEITVKLRPIDSANIADSWFENSDFKCETDDFGATSQGACSLNAKIKGSDFSDQLKAPDLRDLLSDSQEKFISESLAVNFSRKDVLALGPVADQVWDFKNPRFPNGVSLEFWNVKGMTSMIELKSSTDAKSASSIHAALVSLAQENGLALCADQSGKAKDTMMYLASHCADGGCR